MRSILVSFATRNSSKILEIKKILKSEFNLKFLGEYKDIPEIKEDGNTFEENAEKKALILSQVVSNWVLGEDSGLEVDFLRGRPGIFSARYAGLNADAEENNQKLLEELSDVKEELRKASFHCVLVLASRGNMIAKFEGMVSGEIALDSRGENGFGYDSLFIPEGHSKTFAEMDSSEKNFLSHRFRALEKAASWLRSCGYE